MRRTALPALALLVFSAPACAAGLDLKLVDAAGKPVVDAVVSVIPAGGIPKGPIRSSGVANMAQQNIAFAPHVLIVPVGTTVHFPNKDKVRHHIYSFSKAAKFEIKLFGRDETRSYTFNTVGGVALGCNIHDQMSGFIKVVDTPFAAKSNAAGQVSIDGLAPGTAQVTIWHPGLRAKDNEQLMTIPIAGNGTARTITLAVRDVK